MTITINRQTKGFNAVLPLYIYLNNKKFVTSINHNDTLEIPLAEQENQLSLSFLNFPRVLVKDGDKLLIKNNPYWTGGAVAFLLYLCAMIIFWDTFRNARYIWFILTLLNLLIPRFRVTKQ